MVAIDLPRPQIWQRLIALARASPGTLTLPTKEKATWGQGNDGKHGKMIEYKWEMMEIMEYTWDTTKFLDLYGDSNGNYNRILKK